MPKARDVESANKPNWPPEPGSKEERARWLHEWIVLQPPEVQEREKRRRSPCCMDRIGGRYTGTQKDNNVRYVKSCTNCDKILYSKAVWKSAGDEFNRVVEDHKEASLGEKETDVPF